MLRSLVTMVIFGGLLLWAWDPPVLQLGWAQSGGWAVVSYSHRGAGRQAACQAHEPNICSDRDLEVPCPQICPLLGLESG